MNEEIRKNLYLVWSLCIHNTLKINITSTIVHGTLKSATLDCSEDHTMTKVIIRLGGRECHVHVVIIHGILKSATLECLKDHPIIEVIIRWGRGEFHVPCHDGTLHIQECDSLVLRPPHDRERHEMRCGRMSCLCGNDTWYILECNSWVFARPLYD